MGEALSARKFAVLAGCSNVYVSRLVKEGKLPTDENGKIPKEEGLAAFNALGVLGYEANRENAAKAREKSRKEAAAPSKTTKASRKAPETKQDSGHVAIKNTAPAPAKTAAAQQRIELPEDDDAALLLLHEGKLSRAQVTSLYDRWKAKEKHLQMLQREMEYQRAQGRLFELAEVEADAAATAAEVMDKLRSLPPRIAGLCEGRPAREIEGVIDAAINDALAALQKSRFARGTVEG